MIKKYVKRPIVIEAMVHAGGILGWFEAERFIGNEMLFPYMMNPSSDSIHIKTLEGLMECKKGDYIIKGINGEFYPCKPDIFEASYDLVREIKPSELTEEDKEALKELNPCCDNEKRNFNGSCDNCGDPCY